jgi:oligopeptidase B
MGVFLLLAMSVLPHPPAARTVPKELKLHGDTRIDNYFWLREKSNPEVIRHLRPKTPTPRR